MKAIVLAGGKGKRLMSEKSNLPKVLRLINDRPLISYVLENISFIPQKDTFLVVGYKKDMVIDAVEGEYNFVYQPKQLGTGHAVMMAEPMLKEYDGDVLVLYGDMPLFNMQTYKNIIEKHKKSNAGFSILTSITDAPLDYGKVIRNGNGEITDIVEKKDCTFEQLKIKELNVGVYVFNSKLLFESLKYLDNDNKQNEYYLTDVPIIMLKKDIKVESFTIGDTEEIYGVNTLEELELCEKFLNEKIAYKSLNKKSVLI